MNLALVTSPRLAEHTPPPGHPERPERAEVMEVVAEQWRARGARVVAPAPATPAMLARVHAESYLASLEATAGRACRLDPDTFTSPESWALAQLAAGAAVSAVACVLDGTARRAAALVRPPGHHATADRAMGFCLVNNVAVAAAEALARGVPRVAIVDTDVHHGNGTQAIFEADPRVLYISTHQWPLYPGTGAVADVGVGDGLGRTVNLPMPAGCGNDDYELAFRTVVLPVLRQFGPGLILVSAGFDAHELDPLAGMRVTEPGFASMARHLAHVADDCCSGRLVLVTEGGYHLQALASSLQVTLDALADDAPAAPRPERPAPDPARASLARAAVAGARAAQSPFWRGL